MVAAVGALAGAFVVAIVCVSITPLRELTQDFAVCRGADRVERDVKAGGDVRGRDGVARPTTTADLRCFYDGGERTKDVGNDKAFVGGIGVSVLAGILLGGLALLLGPLFRRRRTS